MRRYWRVLLLFTAVAGLANTQEATFNSDVRLVELYATVTDHGGHAVTGLSQNQFTILDEGAPQSIRVFEATEKSLSCALVLDTTGSMEGTLPALRNAARSFINVLRPGDAVAVYAFNEGLALLSPMSGDKAEARRAITRLRAGGRTALFDAISQVALKMERVPGKKAVVVLTDGGDNASVLTRQAASERARKAGIPVFAVAEGDALRDKNAADLLQELSRDTGGRMYRAKQPRDIEKAFEGITADLANGYLLAFAPNAVVQDRAVAWHRLEVQVGGTQKALLVRTRTGYAPD